jgi:prepilin-type N-terminal cleavage/methylation domain-containing protein
MKNNRAFTLVELSIVLLIIGLIIGGITAGSSLIKQAGLRTVISEYNNYMSAINSFKIQFNALPGDIANASTLWPTCDATPSNCNGNSDGMIVYGGNYNTDEAIRAWQQLAAANIIPGSYSGVGVDGGHGQTIGGNGPASKYGPNIGWSLAATSYTYATPIFPSNIVGNYLYIGSRFTNNAPVNNFLSPQDALNIDTKLDDGSPIAGKVAPYDCNNAAWCNANVAGEMHAPSTCLSGNNYNLANTAVNCGLAFFF